MAQIEVFKDIPTPFLNLFWIRFKDTINFSRPNLWIVLGIRGAGKSALLECLAVRHKKIIDLFGAKDNEGLCWCKPEFITWFFQQNGRLPKILLITSDTVQLVTERDHITHKKISDVSLDDFEENDVITTVHDFHENEEQYFDCLQRLVHLLWDERKYWKQVWFVLIREAANWIYARLKVIKDDKMAKKEFIKSLREARHQGLAVGVDTLRWTNIDKELRDIAEYTLIKKTGASLLPDELKWMYGLFGKTAIFNFMKMRTEGAVLSTSEGSVAIVKNGCPEWHKREKENVLATTGIVIKYEQKIGINDDRRYGKSDFFHEEIISKYMEYQSMKKVADEIMRSPATVHGQITGHNRAVKQLGQCPKCYNAKGIFSKDIITKKNKN